jgi:hypothetical protein
VGEGVAVRLLLMGRRQEKTPLTELAESVMTRRAKLVNLPLANDVALRAALRLLGGRAGKIIVPLSGDRMAGMTIFRNKPYGYERKRGRTREPNGSAINE